MTINLKMPHPEPDLKPRITVIGVGGAGGNAVNNMIENNLDGVEFVVTNTDAQALTQSRAERQIQLGRNITQGLGAGSRPDVGRAAAEEAIEDIIEQVEHSNMVFITAGMGGGTGTGAAPVVARAAREQGILTVGVVTKPFQFEGLNRMRIAEEGIEELQHFVDTLIIIPNQNLFRIANEKTTFAQAFEMADDVLYSGVRGVTDLMVMPGLINLDFADVRQVMSEMGKAMMGTGEAEGEDRAIAAAESAISNPLLDDVSMEGARGVLINITGGFDMTLFEVDEAANRIRGEVDADANIIFGSTFDESLDGRMRISVIATGIEAEASAHPKPLSHISLVHDNTYGRKTETDAPAAGPTAGSEPGRADPGTGPAMTAETEDEAPVLNLQPGAAMAPDDGPRRPEARAAAPTAGSESFLPPPPVRVADRPEEAKPPAMASPNPLAEADLVNAGIAAPKSAPPRRKGPSLFERVTGTGRARAGKPSAEAPKPRSAPAEPSLPSAPRAAVPEPLSMVAPDPGEKPALPETPEPGSEVDEAGAAPFTEAKPEAPAEDATASDAGSGTAIPPAPPAEAPKQGDLGGLEPKAELDKDVQEDLLEIPAFLRRQAN
ncbi:MAG: cell division protein FtsZ [Alphaproteobacteria bacterium]|nr:cell division protein FtsZ [Alphaproteobacteria bacterium]